MVVVDVCIFVNSFLYCLSSSCGSEEEHVLLLEFAYSIIIYVYFVHSTINETAAVVALIRNNHKKSVWLEI
jgi:hypothetical protein